MPADCIPYRRTGYFSDLICDYLEEKEGLKPFYNRFPSVENFEGQLQEKKASYPSANRKVLVDSLKAQYSTIATSEATKINLDLLRKDTTFTITTGHQLNLFTGPLYFLYKIISAVNLAAELKEKYPLYDFVPVYWMATEDHDFEEINYFNFNGIKFRWNRESGGAVGQLNTDGLDQVYAAFEAELGPGKNAQWLKELFQKAYLEHHDLTSATRYLANELFGIYGLVIVDGDDTDLKRLFTPYVTDELIDQSCFKAVTSTIEDIKALNASYNIQVNPREINLFYLQPGLRERIVLNDGIYEVNNTPVRFNREEIMREVEAHPERFSPNVMMRPLYEEVILPNLCYIGGGGELAYWLQLREYFNRVNVPFPILLLRNSALLVTEKQDEKLKKLNISYEQLFLDRHSFINRKVREISNINIDLEPQKKFLQDQFRALYGLAEQTDASFLGAVKAQEVKQLKGLDHLEKRLLKAQKRKLSDQVERMTAMQNELFPGGSLQERNSNFSEFIMLTGRELLDELIAELKPLQQDFMVIKV